MALLASNVRVGVTGVVSKAPIATAAPTNSSTALIAAYVDVGYISEDGVSYTAAGAGDTTPIKAWQNGATVRTIRAASDENPSWTFTMIESKKESAETFYGALLTQSAPEGTLNIDTLVTRGYDRWVVDVIDGAELLRVFIPRGIVTEVGDLVYANAEAIGYQVTIEGERDSTLGYNAKLFATAWKT